MVVMLVVMGGCGVGFGGGCSVGSVNGLYRCCLGGNCCHECARSNFRKYV